MKLSDQEKKELLEDGASHARRGDFRAARPPDMVSLEEYLAALDDLQILRPAPTPATPPKYANTRL